MSSYSYRIIIALAFLAGVAACGNAKAESTAATDVSEEPEATALELPSIPDSLVRPKDRAAYALDRFWDALDFAADSRSLDTAFMEQTFANFLSILSVASDDVAQKAVSKLLDKAKARQSTLDVVNYITDKYLDEPGSPMRDEEKLMMFLRHTAADSSLPEVVREVAAIRLSQAEKNRPGMEPADFRILTADGQHTTLRKCLNGRVTVLMFYDPDCDHCMDIKKRLAEIRLHERMQIVAIDIADNQAIWEATKSSMPESWIVGFALDPIEEDETYVLRSMPTFYIIGADGKISMKDPDSQTILGN